MHTKLSSDNPYGYNRWGFAWECVPAGATAHLDFGCHHGVFLNNLKSKEIGRLVGVDISEEAVEKAQQLFPELEIKRIDKTPTLPFDDGTFSSATILDVLEHVYEQTGLLVQLNRVLKEQGILVITVPRQHLFSFLDRGNLKFRFPKLHRWYYCLRHSQQEYQYRYVSNPDGLIGDISTKKRWHEHFSRKKLAGLLEETGFSIIDFDGTGFFSRVIGNVACLLRWIKPLYRVLIRLQDLDAKLFESTNLFCVAKKTQGTLAD